MARNNNHSAQRRVREAVRLMKHEGVSAREAAKRAHTSISAIKRQYGDAMHKERGRWEISGAHFDVLSGGEVIPYVHLSNEDASTVGAHWRAIETYLDTDDPRVLEPFEGELVADAYELETDPDTIQDLADRDQLPVDDIGDSP